MSKRVDPFMIILFLLLIFGVLYLPFSLFIDRPEQSDFVTVVGKRIDEYSSFGPRGCGIITYWSYLVAFKFPDGSEKEIRVDYTNSNNSSREIVFYDSIHEGDTGVLTYKERRNAKYYDDRYFISFKKDVLPKLDD